jgi:hypothetical protein
MVFSYASVIDEFETAAQALLMAHSMQWLNIFLNEEKVLIVCYLERTRGINVTAKGAQKFGSDEEELAHIYGQVLLPDSVPVLRVSIDELRGIELKSKEYFVLSRVNGRWDVRSVATMCPFAELEVLRTLTTLLAKKMIALD